MIGRDKLKRLGSICKRWGPAGLFAVAAGKSVETLYLAANVFLFSSAGPLTALFEANFLVFFPFAILTGLVHVVFGDEIKSLLNHG